MRFSKAWIKSMTPANAVSGFRATGVYPFNRSAISLPITSLDSKENLEEEYSSIATLAEKNGLAYLPLYSHCMYL